MRKRALLRCSSSPVFTLHHSVVGGGTSERDSIPLIVGAHARKCAAPRYPAFEVINVRRFQVRTSGLIVTAIPIKPRNWVGVRAAIRGSQCLVLRRENNGAYCKWD